MHTRARILCYTVLAVLFENGSRMEQVGRVLRPKMEWPSTARRPTDELSGPRERAPSLVRIRVLDSLCLSLSHGTCDGSAQPVVEMRSCPGVLLGADDITRDQPKCQCIEEGETEEAIARCAGPPAAALSMSTDTQHNTRGG